MTARAMKYYILGGVDKVSSLSNKVSTGGRLNAYNTINNVKQYTIRYNSNGGTGNMPDTTAIYYNDTYLQNNNFINNGLPFEGWHAKRSSDNKWYYTDGTHSEWYLDGQQPTGYYKHLFFNGQLVYDINEVNNDTITLYAQWTDIEYIIQFNGNSGTGNMSSMLVHYGFETELPSNTFVKSRFTFDHWHAKNANNATYCNINHTSFLWRNIHDIPSPYNRVNFDDTEYIHTLRGVADGDTITLYAYWEPTFGVLGDANSDGNVTVQDVTEVQKFLADLVTLSSDQQLLSDVNFSNSVNAKDATLIQKYVAGMVSCFGA